MCMYIAENNMDLCLERINFSLQNGGLASMHSRVPRRKFGWFTSALESNEEEEYCKTRWRWYCTNRIERHGSIPSFPFLYKRRATLPRLLAAMSLPETEPDGLRAVALTSVYPGCSRKCTRLCRTIHQRESRWFVSRSLSNIKKRKDEETRVLRNSILSHKEEKDSSIDQDSRDVG